MSSRRERGPIAWAREIVDELREIESMDGGRIITDMGTVEYEPRFGNAEIFGNKLISLQYGFHESRVDNKFEFIPNVDIMGESNANATDLEDLGGQAGDLGLILSESILELPWEFAELDAASISGTGNLTDYEFIYEASTTVENVEEADIDEVVSRIDRRIR